VEWASHEPEPGVYTFDGNLDIESYFKLAQSFNLSIILRPGPFIDAERDMVFLKGRNFKVTLLKQSSILI